MAGVAFACKFTCVCDTLFAWVIALSLFTCFSPLLALLGMEWESRICRYLCGSPPRQAVLARGARIALWWSLEAHFELFLALVTRMALRWLLEPNFELFWALVARIALRWSLEAHFELFWALMARIDLRWRLEVHFELF